MPVRVSTWPLEEREPKTQPDPGDHHRSDQRRGQAARIDPFPEFGAGEDQPQGNKDNQVGQAESGPIVTGQRLHQVLQRGVGIFQAR